MPVKSVIDVEINDAAFRTFNELFQKYKEEVAKMPEDWAKVGTEIKGSAVGFGDLVAAMMAQALLLKTMDDNERKRVSNGDKQVSQWKSISKYSKEVANNIGTGTRFLLKWATAVGSIGGLAGIGSFFGLEHLAQDVSSTRRTTLGLGTTYGEQKAFDVNYGRLVDPSHFLSGVNESLHDITKRYSLYGAGLTESGIQGKDTAQVSAELIPLLKRLADTTPPAVMQQTIEARGLNQITSLQEMMRFRNSRPEELAALQKSYEKDRTDLNVDPVTQLKFQNFTNQLTRAGNKIEKTFVNGLDPLIGPLENLSNAVSDSLATLMKSIKPSDVEAIGKGIEDFAKYLASPDFRKDVHDFAADVSTLAGAIANALRALGSHTIRDAAVGAGLGFIAAGPGGALVGGALGAAGGKFQDGRPVPGGPAAIAQEKANKGTIWDTSPDRPMHLYDPGSWMSKNGGLSSPGAVFGPNATNPGNIRDQFGGFKHFESATSGILAIDNQLRRYATQDKWGKVGTLAEMLKLYAPPSENDTKGYTDFVAKRAKVDPNKPLDFNNKEVMGRVISAMLKMENKKNNYSPQDVEKILRGGSDTKQLASALKKQPPAKVVVQVNNNTGGSAVVSANQAAH